MTKFHHLLTIPLIIYSPRKNHKESKFQCLHKNNLKKRHQVQDNIFMIVKIYSPANQVSYFIGRRDSLLIKLMDPALHNIHHQINLLKNL